MPGHRTSRALLALGAALALLLVGAGPAAAHDEVVATSPATGQSVPTPPPAVELELSSPPQVLGTVVEVTGPDGPVADGAPEVLDTTVRQPLADNLPAGSYAVEWRVTSGDGHAITGSSTFTVAAAATPAPATPEAAPGPADDAGSSTIGDAPASEASASAITGYSPSTGLLVGAGALLVLVVAALVVRRLRRQV